MILRPTALRLGLGCMRLSAREVEPERAEAVIHAALDAGVRLLDTADVYAPDDGQLGHNERLVARALASWTGDRGGVTVVTKGGLTRPGGRWRPDGRAKHLQAACEASLRALGTDRIGLYLLHSVDPTTPLETSVRALSRLLDQGLVEAIGLCNVTLAELERARRLAPIAAVQVALGPFEEAPFRSGLARYCAENGLLLLAHSPFGGPKRAGRLARHPVLRALAQRRGLTPAQLALAWLLDVSPAAVPLPGPTSLEHVRELAAAASLVVGDGERAELDEAFPAGRPLRGAFETGRPPEGAEGEVVLLMGIPGAGKTTAVAELVAAGYERLNRDMQGGRLADLVPALEQLLAGGWRRVVLDNTYASRAERNRVIETAWRRGVPVRCIHLETSLAEAQINAVERMLAKYGRLLSPDEMAAARGEPAALQPRAQFDFERALEPPVLDEGFASIERRPFVRRPNGAATGRAVFFDPDRVDDALAERLRAWAQEGFHLLGLAWRPGRDRGAAPAAMETEYGPLARLGASVEVRACPHPPGPPRCWCRKPLPGLVLGYARDYELDLSACRFVTAAAADRTLAERLQIPMVGAAPSEP